MSVNDKYRAVYKRVETDAEFIARIPYKFVVLDVKKMVPNFYGGEYETIEHKRVRIDTLAGKALDDAVWDAWREQRRIVEDVSQ